MLGIGLDMGDLDLLLLSMDLFLLLLDLLLLLLDLPGLLDLLLPGDL